MAESARLVWQDRLFTMAMDSLLPERSDLSGMAQVLDTACGRGTWVIAMADVYP